MKTIKELIEAHRLRMKERHQRKIICRSEELFQISEYCGQLWLTYNGALVCQTNMFSDDPLMTLAKIRDLYVERNTLNPHDTRRNQ